MVMVTGPGRLLHYLHATAYRTHDVNYPVLANEPLVINSSSTKYFGYTNIDNSVHFPASVWSSVWCKYSIP